MRGVSLKIISLFGVIFFALVISLIAPGYGDPVHFEHGGDHSETHSSVFCSWMCAASNFVGSAQVKLTPKINFSPSVAVFSSTPFEDQSLPFVFQIRPPPIQTL